MPGGTNPGHASRLRRWVDRRFFREAYEADAIRSDLATNVRTIVETRPLLETVATRIAESLHVLRIAILLDDAGTFQPAYAPRVSIERLPHDLFNRNAAVNPDRRRSSRCWGGAVDR